GNGAESACSIVKERCWAGATRVVSTSAARHARVREATNMTVPLGMAASKLSLTPSLGKSYLSRQAAALREDLDHAQKNRRGARGHRRATVLGTGAGEQEGAIPVAAADRWRGADDRLLHRDTACGRAGLRRLGVHGGLRAGARGRGPGAASRAQDRTRRLIT